MKYLVLLCNSNNTPVELVNYTAEDDETAIVKMKESVNPGRHGEIFYSFQTCFIKLYRQEGDYLVFIGKVYQEALGAVPQSFRRASQSTEQVA